MTATIPDLTDWTPDDLNALGDALQAERDKRLAVSAFERQAASALQQARDNGAASTPVDGADWVQPTNALDAYKTGDVVVHDGIRWASLTTPNVWIPGQAGWRAISNADGTTGDGDTSAPPAWVQPSSAVDAYQTGDHVTFNGTVYESVIDGNTWSPEAYPAGWKEVTS